jgi:hypothetical protein
MYNIDKDKQLDIMRWLMYAWDGQWLGRTAAVYGAGEAAKMNSRVRSAFAKIEMKGLLALVGKKQADNLSDAAEMLRTYFDLVFGERGFQGRFSPVAAAPGGGSRLEIQVVKLTALDSLKKVAQAANEPATGACELLWTTWFESLLPDAQLQVASRSENGYEVYHVVSLAEQFTATPDLFDVPMPAEFARPVAPAPVVVAPSPVQPLPANVPNMPPALPKLEPPTPSPVSFSASSPIAEALQIPMEQVKPPEARPAGLIGGSEPGATVNQQSGMGGRLLGNAPAPLSFADLVPGNPPAQAQTAPPPAFVAPVAPAGTPLPSLGVDTSGRPLFSGDLQEEAKMRAIRTKNKTQGGFGRLFMSKQARELMDKAVDEPVMQVTSVAAKVDSVLQPKLQAARQLNPGVYPEIVRVVGGPEGELQIVVGNQVYQSVNDMPPGPVQDIIRQAVDEWSETNM